MSDIFGKVNERGFSYYDFKDIDGKACSLQESSLATEPAVWLGDDDDRMHLTVPMVERLLNSMENWLSHMPDLCHTFKDRNDTESFIDVNHHTVMFIGTKGNLIKLDSEIVLNICDKLVYWLAEVSTCNDEDD